MGGVGITVIAEGMCIDVQSTHCRRAILSNEADRRKLDGHR
jgi:hypothetical protein